MHCPSCSKEIPDQSVACSSCGEPLRKKSRYLRFVRKSLDASLLTAPFRSEPVLPADSQLFSLWTSEVYANLRGIERHTNLQLPSFLAHPRLRSSHNRHASPESISVSRGTFQPLWRSNMVAAVRTGLPGRRQVEPGRSDAVTPTPNPRTNTPRKRDLHDRQSNACRPCLPRRRKGAVLRICPRHNRF
jgi:hypothetical protein